MFSLFFRKPTKDQFAQLMRKELAKAGVFGPFEYRPDDFSLRQGEQILFMGNTFDSYCAVKEPQRTEILANIVSIFKRKEEEVDRKEALSRVVAVVRERVLFAFTTFFWQMEENSNTEKRVAQEPISNWYTRALVLDAPGHMRFVNEEDLVRWGMTFDEMFTIGLERLRDSTPIRFQQEDAGYFMGLCNDDYDSSRILLPELFEKFGLDGDPVFVLPNRLTLMVAGSQDDEAVVAMLVKAEEIAGTLPRPQNPGPLTYRNGSLRDFTVQSGSKLFQPVQRAHGLTTHTYYTEQKERLEELYEKNGKDYFVATSKLVQTKAGDYMSYAVWSKTIATLLPRTDQIFFHDPETKRTLSAPFESALQVVGDLMLDTGMFPPRWYVSQFPTAEQLRVMGGETI